MRRKCANSSAFASRAASTPNLFTINLVGHPASVAACAIYDAGTPSARTVTSSVARSTFAEMTPDTDVTARSTRPTHEAQDILPTENRYTSASTGYPAASSASTAEPISDASSNAARSVCAARLTLASCIPNISDRVFSTRPTHDPQFIPRMPNVSKFCAIMPPPQVLFRVRYGGPSLWKVKEFVVFYLYVAVG